MGQTALKSRSHRRYYLNKVYPFLFAVAKRLFFTSRASARRQLTGNENIDALFIAKEHDPLFVCLKTRCIYPIQAIAVLRLD